MPSKTPDEIQRGTLEPSSPDVSADAGRVETDAASSLLVLPRRSSTVSAVAPTSASNAKRACLAIWSRDATHS
jgi:hypothetical protein